VKWGFSFLLNVNMKHELSYVKLPLSQTCTARVSLGFIFIENIGIPM